MRELCQRYGISPKTGYKWMARFAEQGKDGLGMKTPASCYQASARPLTDKRREADYEDWERLQIVKPSRRVRGKTPVPSAEQTRHLLDSIDATTLQGLRDRAMIATMVYIFWPVSAVLGLKVEDYFASRKGGMYNEIYVHQNAGHESARATGLYDRRDDEVSLDEIELILI